MDGRHGASRNGIYPFISRLRPGEGSRTITGIDDVAVRFIAGVDPHHRHLSLELLRKRWGSPFGTKAVSQPLS